MKNLDLVEPEERKHFGQCTLCAVWFDRRKLNELLHYEVGECIAAQPIQKGQVGHTPTATGPTER
jgi:hypothetical protein